MTAYVLDASAVLAWLLDEPGGDRPGAVLRGAHLSTVNLAEILQKALARGVATAGITDELRDARILIEPFIREDAENVALLWPQTRSGGLSLGDRACLALTLRLGLPAMTADRAWAKLKTGVKIEVIR